MVNSSNLKRKKSSLIYINGIEITSNIVFTGWQPGFEYTKNINFKNLNTKSVRIIYNVPTTKFFTTLFSKVISLSPGTTFTLPITFRPLDKQDYDDYLEVNQIDFQKIFRINLSAKLPQHKIDLASNISFGSACVNDLVSSTIKVNNLSELDTLFEWDINEPFTVSPTNGEIKAHKSIEITFSFHPKSALVYKGNAIIRYGGSQGQQLGLFKSIDLYAIGKYPHILVESENDGRGTSSEVTLNFDKVLIGQNVTKYFTLVNMTEVKTTYFVEKNDDVPVFDRSFNCLQHMGTLQPHERQKIPIVYSPNYPSTDTLHDYFTVYSSGKFSKSIITCIAQNETPKVTIVSNFISFGLCNVGDKIYRTFELKNNCDSLLAFQFDIDNDYSSIKLSVTNGILKPFDTILIQAIFNPIHAVIYYKSIPCLIQNHDVLYVEFIGTAHTELMKPPVLNRKHLNLYYYLKNNNLLLNSPEILAELQNTKKIAIPFDLLNQEKYTYEREDPNESYINDNYHYLKDNRKDCLVKFDNHYIDFGASKIDDYDPNFQQEKSINLFNQTKSKLLIFWNNFENQPFTIHPSTCEIPPMKSYSFRVKFKPERSDQFYKAKLEGYAIYKSVSDYTLADPKFLLPASNLTIECIGHTFHPQNETLFLPKYTLDTENIVFPVSVKDKEIYRTLTLTNSSSDYPLIFDFTNALASFNGIHVKPHQGLIGKDQHQIFLFKFIPKNDNYIIEKFNIMLNYMPKHQLEIGLIGAGLLPYVNLENNGILYFAPTCKNKHSYQYYELTNLTRGCITYEWKIPYESKDLFSVNEIKSTLQPYEKKKCLWKFTPDKIDKYNHKMNLVAWIDKNKQPKIYNFRILASCTSGSLQSNEMYKDFGSVIVGSSVSSEIVILNNNDCYLDFELDVKQTVEESGSSTKMISNDLCTLELDKYTGHIEARSKLTIRCRFRPTRLINYQFVIHYKLIYSKPKNDESSQSLIEKFENNLESPRENQSEVLCYLTANGVYPKLKITDIKGLGSASGLSKDYLWKLLSINELNTSMSCEPNPDELIYSIATRQEPNKRVTSHDSIRPIIDLNFNAAPLNSDDSQIVLFVENVGLVGSDWILLFPKDLLLELEYWAQSGDFDLDELEQMKVQDNKLFTIEPKKGHLEPGETVRITITYKHIFTGQNKLPILMKLAKGREIMLNFIGATSAPNESYLYFPSNKFEFEPVEIGLIDYPVQVYELYNGGDSPAHVEIDCSSVDYLNAENYGHEILKCLSNESIVIPPGNCFETKWKFSPIEAKTYQVDILFKTNQIIFNAVTFKLVGYDKRKLNNAVVTNKNQEIPEKQVFMLPNQLATLSIERILLGDVPLFSRERKVLFIKNNSFEHRISFAWHVTNPDHIKFIRIQPSRGVVDPNQSKMCKITFISKDKAAFYNIDLICEVKNETEMTAYRNDLEQWRQEQNRQFEEFIIDERELESRLKSESRIRDNKDIKQPNEKMHRVGSTLAIQKFKTIPPIVKNSLLSESNVERIRRTRDEKRTWKKPLPPNPFLLHLNILARTQYFDEYLEMTNTCKNNSLKFVDPLLGNPPSVSNALENSSKTDAKLLNSLSKIDTSNLKLVCTEKESDTLDFVLSDLIRNLISDKSFHTMVQNLKDEEVPYFFQYSSGDSQNPDKIEEPPKKLSESSMSKLSKLNKKKSDASNNKKSGQKSIQALKTSPIFNSLIENIFENTISNILTEAFSKEFSLTSRPRLIALPPKLSTIITEHPPTPIINNLNPLTSSHGSANNSTHSLANKSKTTLMTTEPNSSTNIENSQVLLSGSRDINENTNNNNNISLANNSNANIMQIA